MSNLIIHLLQSAIGIGLFYGVYWLLLRNMKWFSLNRILIILFLLLSVLLPFITISGQVPVIPVELHSMEVMNTSSSVSNPQSEMSHGTGISYISILSIIYISGATFFLLRFFYSLLQLTVMYVCSPRVRKNNFIVVLRPGKQSPFTFFNLLFVSEEKFYSENFHKILLHESVHHKQWHSLDNIVLELISIIQWFNPFVWLFRKALKTQHEYLADRSVINKGVCRLSYQKILFEESVGVALNLTSNFHYSLLKQRLKMMTLEKNKNKEYIRYLLLAPMVLVVSLFLMGHSGSNAIANDPIDAAPEYKEGQENLMFYLQSNARYPQTARKNNLQATVYVNFEVAASGEVNKIWVAENAHDAHALFDELIVVAQGSSGTPSEATSGSEALEDMQTEAVRLVEGLGDFTPARYNEAPVKAIVCLPVTFVVQ